MDIEQLKLILEATKGVGDTALTVAGLYFAKDLLVTCLGFGLALYVIKTAVLLIRQGIDGTGFNRELMSEINTTLYLNRDEQRRIIDLIRKGKAAEDKK